MCFEIFVIILQLYFVSRHCERKRSNPVKIAVNKTYCCCYKDDFYWIASSQSAPRNDEWAEY
jgi:hypothetical protein